MRQGFLRITIQFKNFKNMSTEQNYEYEQDNQIQLKEFAHQVGGRAKIYFYDKRTLCKPYVARELYFYSNIPSKLIEFTPSFKGIITVSLDSSDDTKNVAYALPKTKLKPNSKELKSLIKRPRIHSRRCIKDVDQLQAKFCSEDTLCFEVSSLSVENSTDFENDQIDVCIRPGIPTLTNSWSVTEPNKRKPWIKSKEIRSHENNEPTEKRFLLLENITCEYKKPCVLDLKVGTCIRSSLKMEKLDAWCTRLQLGIRLSGMQLYDTSKSCYYYLNKYDGQKLNSDGLRTVLYQFFSHSFSRNDTENQNLSLSQRKMIIKAIEKVKMLYSVLKEQVCRRFYSCSVLIAYDASMLDTGVSCPLSVKIIDFAHYCLSDQLVHPGVDDGLLFGIKNIFTLLESFLD